MANKKADNAKRIQKAIQLYHDSLAEYRGVAVKHEGPSKPRFSACSTRSRSCIIGDLFPT